MHIGYIRLTTWNKNSSLTYILAGILKFISPSFSNQSNITLPSKHPRVCVGVY